MAGTFYSLTKHWKRILPCFGILLFIILIWKVNPARIWNAVTHGNPNWLLYLLVITPLTFILQAFRWHLIINRPQERLPFIKTFIINLIGVFYGTITPGHTGSLLKITYLKDIAKISLSESSASFILDKLLDVVVLLLFAMGGTYLLMGQFKFALVLQFIVLSIFIAGFVYLYHQERAKEFLKIFVGRIIPEDLANQLKEPFEQFFDSLPYKRNLLLPLLISILVWTCIFTQSFIIAKSLNVHLNYFLFIFLYPLGTLVGLLPISFSGLGTRELTLVSIFHLFNIAPDKIVGFSLLALLIGTYIPALFGWLCTFKKL